MKKLLKAGCQPYFQMLEKWLCEGDLDDPFQEFMVCQDPVSVCLNPGIQTECHPYPTLLRFAQYNKQFPCSKNFPYCGSSFTLNGEATGVHLLWYYFHNKPEATCELVCQSLQWQWPDSVCISAQAVGRDAVTSDNHSGFWHQRYTLRHSASSSDSGKQNRAPDAEGRMQYTPVFLENLKATILTTGGPSLPHE